ncbi:hypothetical protein E4U55_001299 [Claviceps digitariae]|nr:hypothetical protein E4U55_001299 [Claviceps digitariae]
MASEHPDRNRALYGREKRLRGRLHEGWEAICVGTALCDFCSKQSRGVVQKCVKCGLSICSQCSRRGALRGNRNHRLDHDAVCWDRTAVEIRRCRKVTGLKVTKKARHDRVVSVSEQGETMATVHGQQQQQEEDEEEAESAAVEDEEEPEEEAPSWTLQTGRQRRQRRRRHCEKETQTPGWWIAEGPMRNPFPVSTMDVGSFHPADEHDAAKILAGMALSGAIFRERTILDIGSQRAAAGNARFADHEVLYHHRGGQQALYHEGTQRPETDKRGVIIGHQARVSPSRPDYSSLQTRFFGQIGRMTPSSTRSICTDYSTAMYAQHSLARLG